LATNLEVEDFIDFEGIVRVSNDRIVICFFLRRPFALFGSPLRCGNVITNLGRLSASSFMRAKSVVSIDPLGLTATSLQL